MDSVPTTHPLPGEVMLPESTSPRQNATLFNFVPATEQLGYLHQLVDKSGDDQRAWDTLIQIALGPLHRRTHLSNEHFERLSDRLLGPLADWVCDVLNDQLVDRHEDKKRPRP